MNYREMSMKTDDNSNYIINNIRECIYNKPIEDLTNRDNIRYEKSIRDLKYILNYLSESIYFKNKDIFI